MNFRIQVKKVENFLGHYHMKNLDLGDLQAVGEVTEFEE